MLGACFVPLRLLPVINGSGLLVTSAGIAAAALSAGAAAQTTLLTDNFNTEASFTASPNADQGGLLAPAIYTVGNPFGAPSQRRGAGVLELAFDGTTSSLGSRVYTDAGYANVANTLNSPVRITFDINAAQVDWVGLVVGTTSAWLDGNGATTEFSALFRNDGTGNKWVNGGNQGGLATDTSSLITLELRNTVGTGSPFNGTGSVAQLWRGTTNLGTYTLEQLSSTNGRFALCTYSGNFGAGGTVDNLSIITTSTATLVPRWSGSVNGTWDEATANFSGQSFSALKTAGATNVLFGDNDASFNPVATSNVSISAGGVEIADVVFDNVAADYTLASADANGIKGATNLAKSGTGLLTLAGANSYTGTTTISGGTIALSGGNNRLPVTTALTLASPGVLRLDGNNQEVASLASNGRVVNGNATLATLTVNNSAAATFSGNLGGPGTDENNLALVKDGSGTLTLSLPSTFTGGTTIENGTLALAYGDPFATNSGVGPMSAGTAVIINSGGILTGTNNNWLATTSVNSGATNAPTVTVNAGGTLRGASGFVSGLGNLTLNGGTLEVTNGYGQFGWNACFNLGGDITVSGTAASSITTSSGAGATANIYMANGSNGTGGTRTFTVNDVTGSAASDLVVSAQLARGTVIKAGAGTIELAAGATGTETPVSWQVNNGKLLVNANVTTGGVSVASGGTLAGSGTVGATTVDGTFAPGNSIGTLTIGGALDLNGTSIFEIDPTLGIGLNRAADLATTSGIISYGGILNVLYSGLSSDFTNGMVFNLFDATSFTDSFSTINLPTLSGGLTWENNLGTNGTLVVVPEPGAALLGGLGLLALLRRRRV